MQGNKKMKDAKGGVLLVNIDEEDPINSKLVDEIIAAMDEGDISIIFAGTYKALNQYMKFNNELYKSTIDIADKIAALAPESLRRLLNAHLLDQMLIEARKVAERSGEKTIFLRDLAIGIHSGAQIYKNLLNL
ncbi:UNVERIFIED_CONTAM: hypothetical protein Sangu_2081300 [Sesamum angustifolium]|uniref:Uncharacterized protein n=1 Tax=Sesamum angustifolium TaxID=2727405 RepID=A0AAW2LM46_9LAMI